MELSPSMVVEVASNSSAGFGIRFAARLIDMIYGMLVGVFGGAVGGFITGLLASLGYIQGDWMAAIQDTTLPAYVWSMLGGVLYGMVAEVVGGATVGKLLLGLRVTSEDLTPCTFKGALIRNTAYFIDSFFFGIPAYTAMSGSMLNQRYGDQWGRTVVMRASAVPPDTRKSTGLVVLGLFAGSAVWGLCIAFAVVLRAA